MSDDSLSSRQPISETEAAVLKDLQRSWARLHMDAMDERILQGNLDLCSIGVETPLLMYEVGGGDGTDTRSAKYENLIFNSSTRCKKANRLPWPLHV